MHIHFCNPTSFSQVRGVGPAWSLWFTFTSLWMLIYFHWTPNFSVHRFSLSTHQYLISSHQDMAGYFYLSWSHETSAGICLTHSHILWVCARFLAKKISKRVGLAIKLWPHLATSLSFPNLSLGEFQAQNGVTEIGLVWESKWSCWNWVLEAPKSFKTRVIETPLWADFSF